MTPEELQTRIDTEARELLRGVMTRDVRPMGEWENFGQYLRHDNSEFGEQMRYLAVAVHQDPRAMSALCRLWAAFTHERTAYCEARGLLVGLTGGAP